MAAAARAPMVRLPAPTSTRPATAESSSAVSIVRRRLRRSASGPKRGAVNPATIRTVTSPLAAASEISKPRAMLGRKG